MVFPQLEVTLACDLAVAETLFYLPDMPPISGQTVVPTQVLASLHTVTNMVENIRRRGVGALLVVNLKPPRVKNFQPSVLQIRSILCVADASKHPTSLQTL